MQHIPEVILSLTAVGFMGVALFLWKDRRNFTKAHSSRFFQKPRRIGKI